MKFDLPLIGHWAFLIGMALAVIAGAGFANIPALPAVLFVLGLIVGFLNVTEKESTPFLVAVIALLLIGVAGFQYLEGLTPGRLVQILAPVISNFIAFVAAAGLVVAIKQALGIVKKPAPEA